MFIFSLFSFSDLALGEYSRKRKNERSISSLHTFSDSGTVSSVSGTKPSLLMTQAMDFEQSMNLADASVNNFQQVLAQARTVSAAAATNNMVSFISFFFKAFLSNKFL